ncbi:hypothetical protein D3C76_1351300 [compost metagenome]
MLALGTGIEPLQPVGDGVVHALVETGFKMQAVVFGQAAPVTPIETIITHQTERHGHRAARLPGQHHPDRLGHALGQQAEELPRQVRRLTAHGIGIGIAGIHEIPLDFAQLLARVPVKFDAMASHLFTFLAHLLALA